MAVIVETDRLILRQFTQDDLNPLHAIMSDPDVMRYIGNGALKTLDEVRHVINCAIVDATYAWSRETLARLPQLNLAPQRGVQFSMWAAIHKPDNRLIGRCGLLAWDVDGQKEVEVGYVLAKPYWGQGLATEAARASRDYAFARLGVDRVISIIQPGNVASQRVAIKNGMRHERDWAVGEIPVRVYGVRREIAQ